MIDIVLAFMACAILIEVARQDLFHRRIPNRLSIAIAGLGAARWIARADLALGLWSLAAGAAVLVLTALLLWRNLIGGGDAKLLPALTFLVAGDAGFVDRGGAMSVNVTSGQIPGYIALSTTCTLLLRTALIGGVVSLAVLVWYYSRGRLRGAGAQDTSVEREPVTVPYGIAIAAAGVWVLTSQVIES